MPQPHVPSPEVIREFNDRGTLWLLEDPANLRDLLRIVEPEVAEPQPVTVGGSGIRRQAID